MKSYHGSYDLKDNLISEVTKHIENIKDNCPIIYFLCSILDEKYESKRHNHNFNLKFINKKLGIPIWLVSVYNAIYRQLPKEDRSKFAIDFLYSIPIGVDLKVIRNDFCVFLLKENINNLENIMKLEDLENNSILFRLISNILDYLNSILYLYKRNDKKYLKYKDNIKIKDMFILDILKQCIIYGIKYKNVFLYYILNSLFSSIKFGKCLEIKSKDYYKDSLLAAMSLLEAPKGISPLEKYKLYASEIISLLINLNIDHPQKLQDDLCSV